MFASLTRRICAVACIAVLALWPVAGWGAQPTGGPTVGTSVIQGKLFGLDGQPLAGATVVAYHLSTEKVFRSTATGPDGKFDLSSLPYGYYDIAVETAAGLYVGQVVNVPPASEMGARLELAPFADDDPARERAFPGSDRPAVGVARLEEHAKGPEFWRSSKGVAILAGGGAAVLLLLAGGGGGGEDDASPFEP